MIGPAVTVNLKTASSKIRELCDYIKTEPQLEEYVKYIPDDDWFKQLNTISDKMDPFLQTENWRLIHNGPGFPTDKVVDFRNLIRLWNDEPVTVITRDKRPLSLWIQDGEFWSLDGAAKFDPERLFLINVGLDRKIWRDSVASVSPDLDVDLIAVKLRERKMLTAKSIAGIKTAKEKERINKNIKDRKRAKAAKISRKQNRKKK